MMSNELRGFEVNHVHRSIVEGDEGELSAASASLLLGIPFCLSPSDDDAHASHLPPYIGMLCCSELDLFMCVCVCVFLFPHLAIVFRHRAPHSSCLFSFSFRTFSSLYSSHLHRLRTHLFIHPSNCCFRNVHFRLLQFPAEASEDQCREQIQVQLQMQMQMQMQRQIQPRRATRRMRMSTRTKTMLMRRVMMMIRARKMRRMGLHKPRLRPHRKSCEGMRRLRSIRRCARKWWSGADFSICFTNLNFSLIVLLLLIQHHVQIQYISECDPHDLWSEIVSIGQKN